MMKHLKAITGLLCAGLMLCLPLQCFAQEPEDFSAAIEDYAAENPNDYVSFAAAVVDADEILYTGEFGYIDRENSVPADADTVYEWGSVSKTMVWVSVMQLWEQGKLDLEADVRSYLPADFFHNLRYDAPITMRDLMNHEGGWGENTWALQTGDADAIPPLGQALQDTEPAQLLPPETTASYANWGAALAAYVVERVSGEDYADYVHAHILEPLGMEHTSVNPTCSDNPWVQERRQKLVSYAQTAPETWIATGRQLCYIKLYPAGSVTSSIGDMALYAQSFVQDPCPLFEKPDTLEVLLSPTSTVGSTDVPALCHGFMPERRGEHMTYGHSGATNACSSNFRFCPETGIAAVVLMNSSGAPPSKVPGLVFGEMTPPETDGIAFTDHSDISGVYFGMRGIWHGPLKIMSLLGILPVTKTGEDTYTAAGVATLTRTGDDTLLLEQGDMKVLCTYSVLPDGTKAIDLGGQSYLTSGSQLVSLVLLCMYFLMMLIGIVLLLVKLVRLILKKRRAYLGAGWITAAQIMRVVSVVTIGLLLSVFSAQYGITKPQGYIACGVELLCLLTFAAAAVSSVRGLVTKNGERANAFQYTVNAAANVLSAAAVIALELVRFWGI